MQPRHISDLPDHSHLSGMNTLFDSGIEPHGACTCTTTFFATSTGWAPNDMCATCGRATLDTLTRP